MKVCILEQVLVSLIRSKTVRIRYTSDGMKEYIANQDARALMRKSNRILPITPVKLQLETSVFNFLMYMSRATKKYK